MSIQSEIHDHVVSTYAPELSGEGLPADYDLLAGGIVDSLALLGLIEWIQQRFQISALGGEVTPEDFSSIESISNFVRSRGATPVSHLAG